jgi:Helix-turn-helix domain
MVNTSQQAKRKFTISTNAIATPNDAKLAHYAALLIRFAGNDSASQRTRLHLALQHAPLSTYEARKYLGVYYAPARIMELRAQGICILTRRVTQQTDAGIIHQRIGLYVLRSSETCHQRTCRFTLRQVELFVGQAL